MTDPTMPLRSHLDELRRRLTIAALSVLVTTVISFVFYKQIIEFLLGPAGAITDTPGRLVFIEVTEMFGVMMKVSLVSGLVIALPIIMYQIIKFASPGMTSRERRYLFAFMPAMLMAFVGGAAFGYFVLIPPAITFLVTFGDDVAEPMIRIGSYINLAVMLLFWMGVVFETPLVMYILARFGVVSHSSLSRWRRYWLVIAFVLGAIITPTFDPINQTLVAVPLIVLYEVGVLLSKLATRGRMHTDG
ncbi:twin-arginine translocase subunit TatC [SAR202 cluster bacterium AD-804-J14_MRT_500m]|nr:twin-arginine translocase subunit TatC [SAR202 cluster bacterium AD-804-J14_MRT_500m]